MSAARLLVVALAITPAGMRARMREEWQADIEGAGEVGLSAWSIARGALGAAITARARLVSALMLRAASATSPVAAGILIGAICAIGDVSVLAVFVVIALAQAAVSVGSRWIRRSTAPALDARRAV